MRNIKVFLVLVLSLVFLTSCGATSLNGRTNKQMWGKFDFYYGEETNSFNVKNDETINIVIELIVDEGELNVILEDYKGNVIFETDKSDTFEYTPTSDTQIKVSIYAKGASGSYKVSLENLEKPTNNAPEVYKAMVF